MIDPLEWDPYRVRFSMMRDTISAQRRDIQRLRVCLAIAVLVLFTGALTVYPSLATCLSWFE